MKLRAYLISASVRLLLVPGLHRAVFPKRILFFLFSNYSLNESLINSLSNELTFSCLRCRNLEISQVPLTLHLANFRTRDFTLNIQPSQLRWPIKIILAVRHTLWACLYRQDFSAHAASSQFLQRRCVEV